MINDKLAKEMIDLFFVSTNIYIYELSKSSFLPFS